MVAAEMTLQRTRDLALRAQKSVVRDGLLRTVLRVLQFAMVPVTASARARGTARRERDASDRWFDSRLGVETAGACEVSRADVVGPHWARGVAYQPVPPTLNLHRMLEALSLPYEEMTFIDLGAGKARALLVAAALPFRQLIGVEYSATLAAIARANVEKVGDSRLLIVHEDAAEYRLPLQPLVLFLYNPFDEAVMSRVIGNVSQSYGERERRIVVAYYVPQLGSRRLWDGVGFLHCVRERDDCVVYDTGRYAPPAIVERKPGGARETLATSSSGREPSDRL
jgi:hypothetical protein